MPPTLKDIWLNSDHQPLVPSPTTRGSSAAHSQACNHNNDVFGPSAYAWRSERESGSASGDSGSGSDAPGSRHHLLRHKLTFGDKAPAQKEEGKQEGEAEVTHPSGGEPASVGCGVEVRRGVGLAEDGQ